MRKWNILSEETDNMNAENEERKKGREDELIQQKNKKKET